MRGPPDSCLARVESMSTPPRAGERRAIRVLRLMLALYPGEFRDQYGRELSLLFIDRYRDAATWRDLLTLWLDVLTGLAREVPKEHCRMVFNDLWYALR